MRHGAQPLRASPQDYSHLSAQNTSHPRSWLRYIEPTHYKPPGRKNVEKVCLTRVVTAVLVKQAARTLSRQPGH